MKKHIVLLSLVSLIGCTSTKYMSSGAKDNKPLLFEDEYELSKLNEINLEGSAFWGIPLSSELTKEAKNKRGHLFTFNGVNVSKSTKIIPILSMIGYTVTTGFVLNTLAGNKQVEDGGYYDNNIYYPYYTSKPRLPLVVGLIIGVPIAGTLNNLTFSNSALGSAGSALNYKLITENPEIDLYVYPKYTINKEMGIWKQKATLKANLLGAKLKLD
jgi:hypothetical protein